MSIFGRNSHETYGVIIHVGSGSIGIGIIVSNRTEKTPRFLYFQRELIRIGKKSDLKADHIRRMREALFSGILKLSQTGLKKLTEYDSGAKIGRILVTCSSPWAFTNTREVVYENENRFRVTPSLLKNLSRTAEKQVEKDFNELDIVKELGLQITERATVDVKLNGYRISHYEGKKANNITLSHTTGLVPSDIVDAVHEIQDKILVDTALSVHTFMLVSYCVLRDLYPKLDNFTIIDVTGESTEVGVVEGGTLVYTNHNNCGSNTLIRSLTEEHKTDHNDIIAQLRILSEGTNDADTQKLAAFMQQFDDALINTLIDLESVTAIDSTITVIALPEFDELFQKYILQLMHRRYHKKFKFVSLSNAEVESEEGIHPDIFARTGARFFHKLHGCGEIETI